MLLCACLILASAFLVPAAPWTNGVVAAGHPAATWAGLNILKSGGNAFDAAVAVALTLGVVDAKNSGIGGGCFILIHLPNGQSLAIDGRETAPAAAHKDMFVRDGIADPALSQTGPLASGVPGSLAAYAWLNQHYGRKSLTDLILPAADLAAKGFPISKSYARQLRQVAPDLRRFEASRALFFKGKRTLHSSELLKQPDLAATYRGIAEQGADWFYNGPFADRTGDWMRKNGGLLTAADFHSYKVVIRQPILTTYRGCQIIGFPPPGSGGVHVAQILNTLEPFNLRSDPASRLHLIAEAMKFAFADRAYWLGDPDFVDVPRGLIDPVYASDFARKIDPLHATPLPVHGFPPGSDRDFFNKHTTHFSVADAQGNWIAATATLNTSFGSKVVIPGTGVVLNNQMDDFSIQPGITNAFGLLGADANAVAPAKRPLSSMSPTIVLTNGQPFLALGAAGGPRIISAVVCQLVSILDLGLSPAQAIAAPRIHHQWRPDRLVVERKLPTRLKRALQTRGHTLQVEDAIATSQLIAKKPGAVAFTGAADPRGEGSAAGW